jgi:AraC family transcriptional regulator
VSARSRPADSAPNDQDRILFRTDLVGIGSFRARPGHPLFRDSGPISAPLFGFPRNAVRIQHLGRTPFVANANVVTYYNAGQLFLREPVDPEGDRSEYFTVSQAAVLDLLQELDPSVAERPDRPFPFALGPGDPRTYIRQRALVHYVCRAGELVDALAVEETVMSLLFGVAGRALGTTPRRAALTPAHRDLAERLKVLLASDLQEPRTLADLASELRCSPFYLARVFRAAEGESIHRYRTRLRLARSLESLAIGRGVRAVAFEVGFGSHSHFTAAFHHAFGITPSRFRKHASGRFVRQLLEVASRSDRSC